MSDENDTPKTICAKIVRERASAIEAALQSPPPYQSVMDKVMAAMTRPSATEIVLQSLTSHQSIMDKAMTAMARPSITEMALQSLTPHQSILDKAMAALARPSATEMALQSLTSHQSVMDKAMAALARPSATEMALQSLASYQSVMDKVMAAMARPSAIEAALQSFTSHQSIMDNALAAMARPSAIEAALRSLTTHQSIMDNAAVTMMSLGSMFVNNGSDVNHTMQQMSDIILHEKISNIFNINDLDVNFELDSETIESTVTELGAVSLPENKSDILEWYNKQSPAVQLVIGLFLGYWVSVLCNLSMPLYEDWSHIFTSTDSRQASKQVVHEARNEHDINDLKSYRFVIASVLHVRSNPTINSEILDELKNGKPVRFIEKSKRWVLIEYWCDDTGEYRKGWVFARYLLRFEI
ncbi:SH3 domain-containing protein [Photobacterium halotolerans]|uniref:SH3 domain-containing protein n=1 Tax=Photobacterium halotolerans TaxID=265726 RepID=A0A7X4WAM2_9GAMM|nr:SH3 domain-containing protein [Photobacterium halotolerans]NAW65201.1 SH3 domain-containing protein [Photobacterium halotolerans]